MRSYKELSDQEWHKVRSDSKKFFFTRLRKLFFSQFILTWRVIGLFLIITTSISLIKNGFDIPLYGLPQYIYKLYIWFRDTLFVPLELILNYFDYKLHWYVKDLITLYLFLGSTFIRAIYNANALFDEAIGDEGGNVKLDTVDKIKYNTLFFLLVLIWPRYLVFSFIDFKSHKTIDQRAGQSYGSINPYYVEDLIVPATFKIWYYLIAITIITVIMFFTWNYIIAVFGPQPL